MYNNLWIEKYRPTTLGDIILSPENRNYFENIKDEIPNLLFVGTPGIGKTTIARILVQDILKCQYLYINASDENGIDTIRSKVSGFSQTKSIDGKVKIVILDEADGITIDGQRALRNTMEEYSGYTRFILTANYKHKIIPAIQSRTQCFDLTLDIPSVVNRVIFILKSEKIKVSASEQPKLVKIIKGCFPDIRRTINTIQKYCVSGVLTITDAGDQNEFITTIHNYIETKKVFELRKFLIDKESVFQSDYNSILKNYLNYVYELQLDDQKKRQVIVTISEYLYRDVFVVDKEINAFACFCQIEQLLS